MNTRIHFPYKRILFVVFCSVLILNLISPQAAIGQSVPEPGATTVDAFGAETDVHLYLPFTGRNYCAAAYTSPFAIQIAGLSEFVSPASLSTMDDAQKSALQAEYSAQFPSMMQTLQESGAGWARVYIDWSIIQPTDPAGGSPTYNWAWYDDKLGQVAASGVQMIATISNPPAWAWTSTTDPCSNKINSEKLPDFNAFVTALVTRYKADPYNIHVWEILNEPDAIDGKRCSTGLSNYGNHGVDYAALVQMASSTIKALDPIAKVIMGGIAYDWFYLPESNPPYNDGAPDGAFNRYFIDDVISSGAANNLDGINFHYFPDFHPEWERWTVGDLPTCGNVRTPSGVTFPVYGLDVVAKGSFLVNRLKTCFNVEKPLWITEVGMHGTADTLDDQAQYVLKVYARGLSLGAENIAWYALKIIPSITVNDYQGLLYDSRDGVLDNTPKPAFYAYQMLTRELDGYSYLATLPSPANTEAYSFVNACLGTKIIAWANQDTPVSFVVNNVNAVRLSVRSDSSGTPVTSFVADGGVGDGDGAKNGRITIQLTVEPVIIDLNP